MTEFTIRCGCGRAMTLDAPRGRCAYRCGCGARVRVEDAPRQAKICVAVESGTACRFAPVTAEPVALCKGHARALREQLMVASLACAPLAEEDATELVAAWLDRTVSGGIDRDALRRQRRADHARAAALARQDLEAASVVYYIQFGDRIKIGTTTDLGKRLGALPHDCLLATEPGGPLVERQRHEQFGALRIKGEWFEPAPVLLGHIQALPRHASTATPPRRSMPTTTSDGRILMATTLAADVLGVNPSTVSRWRSLGYLSPAPGGTARKPLYAWDDVLEAQRLARDAAIATSGSDKRVRRNMAA